jgi:hypothetical protein
MVTDALLKECNDILFKGAEEYGGKDRLQNFKDAAKLLGISPEQVAFVYFYKHVCGIAKYVSDRKPQRDTIRGRIVDATNYLILLNAILSEDNLWEVRADSPPKTGNMVLQELYNQSTINSTGANYHKGIGERA